MARDVHFVYQMAVSDRDMTSLNWKKVKTMFGRNLSTVVMENTDISDLLSMINIL